MTTEEMRTLVKRNLDIADAFEADTDITDASKDLIISDVITKAQAYCNIVDLPDAMEPFIRKKVRNLIGYEAVNGSGYAPEITSIHEGDGSLTFATGGSFSREGIYGLSEEDKRDLRQFRRLRGYV